MKKGLIMTIKIENPEIENYFITYFQSDTKKFSEFILENLKKYQLNKNQLTIKKFNPIKNSYKLKGDFTQDSDEYENPFKDVDDVVEYAKRLREISWR